MAVRPILSFALALASGAVMVAACAPDGTGETNPGQTTGSGASGAGASGLGGGNNFGASGGSGAGVGGGCADIPAEAKNRIQPSDIILAIDQSGSMDDETNWVKDQLNGFAQQITSSGIDVHVVVIAGKPGTENGFCIPAPLGAGACPADDNPPTFLHVPEHVDSNNALQKILATYPQYEQALRPDASKHIIVITDDESDMAAAAFDQQLKALDPPLFDDYHFHAIAASEDDPGSFSCSLNPTPCCDIAEEEGKVYKALVQMTGGIFGDLCAQDFQPVWDTVSTQVQETSKIACEWEIPEPPDGEELNPNLVNFGYSVDGGAEQDLGQVPSEEDCAAHDGGWYYDNPASPKVIRVCDETCAVLQAASEAVVNIKFGCETTVAPPK